VPRTRGFDDAEGELERFVEGFDDFIHFYFIVTQAIDK
jgi:hypothetical protein